MNPYKARKMAKVIAILIVVAMVVTSLSVIFVVPSMFGSSYGVVYAAEENDLSQKQVDTEYKRLQEYMNAIKKYYKDTVTLEMLMDGAFSGTSDSLNDPYSVFYRNFEDKNDFAEAVEGEFFGIGVSVLDKDGGVIIESVISGGSAEKAGIKVGDIIVQVNGVSTVDMSGIEITSLLKGQVGTEVEVKVSRNGQQLSFKITRETIKKVSVYSEMIDEKIGYIKITGFDNDTDEELANARQAILKKNAKGFIIDIRENGGGYLNIMGKVLEMLLPKGVMYHLESQGKIVQTIEAPGAEVLYPTVLLVNEYTASASEVMAISLKENKAATLVGKQTYGKGVAQEILNLGNDKYAKLSTAYTLSPNKVKYDGIGVTPDYVVENYSADEMKQLREVYALFAPMSEKTKPSEGTTGLNVYGAQQRLALLGYKIEVSGTMDEMTVKAVREFQKENKLSPYGVLDYTTMDKLDEVALNLISGAYVEDVQMKKGIEVLNTKLK